MITSTAWSPDLALGQAKAAELALMVIATAVIARSVTTSDSVVYLAAVWRWLLVILAALALLGLAGAASGSRAAVLGGGPNIFGRNMGLLTVASLWLALGRRSVVWALVATLAASLCVLSGSRGAMIATASALSVVLVARRASMTRSALILAVTGLLGFALLLWTDLGIQTLASFRHRVIDLLIEQRYGSARELLYPRALELAGRHPIVGGGLAAFGAENVWRYPHNLFLEALCEGGVVGLVVLAVPLLHWGGTIALRGRGAIDVNVAALVLFLVASQFSGDVFDSRGVFAFLVLSSAYSGVIAWGQEREP
jgi:O-antigen ligase